MSNAEEFEELLRSDEVLQARLRTATEAYEGGTTDGRVIFDAIIAPLAAEVGLPFTYDEARALLEEGAEVSDEKLESVAGGVGRRMDWRALGLDFGLPLSDRR